MAANEYHFVTRWRIAGSVPEVADVLFDAEALKHWWPSVYLDVKVTSPGDPQTGVGREVSLYTKGWLPYTLRWSFRIEAADLPRRFALRARGDFEGRGEWSLTQDGDFVDVVYDWRIVAEKPLLRYLSFALKPFFRVNHEWAMARGAESLRLELRRRRAATEDERRRVPPPPRATFAWATRR
jgi:hypothetical protein